MTRVLLLVTGGIASYKSCYLVRRLMERDYEVQVAMTPMAREFVGTVTFEALSGNPVATTVHGTDNAMEHITLAEWADVIVVAPATANAIAKLAHGIADDIVTTLLLAATSPVLVAPAMNTNMWNHPATQANVKVLVERGLTIIPPGEGLLACLTSGAGKMAEPDEICDWVEDIRDEAPDMRGVKLLVSAGPTREFVDPFRFLSNPSTGKMGIAVAATAWRRGAEVTLVHGPVSQPIPRGVEAVAVTSAAEMHHAVESRLAAQDALVMTSAVADFRPIDKADHKLKKAEGFEHIPLEPTTDILKTASVHATSRQVLVGFCAESRDIEENARRKLEQKDIDIIVANNIVSDESGFAADTNKVTIFMRHGEQVDAPLMSKRKVAVELLRHIARLVREKRED